VMGYWSIVGNSEIGKIFDIIEVVIILEFFFH